MRSFVANGHGSAIDFTLVTFGDAFASTRAPAPDDGEITTFYLINAAVALTGDAAVPASAVRRPWAVGRGPCSPPRSRRGAWARSCPNR